MTFIETDTSSNTETKFRVLKLDKHGNISIGKEWSIKKYLPKPRHFFNQNERFNALHTTTLQDFEFNPTPNNATIDEAIDFIKPYLELKPLFKAINEREDNTYTKRDKVLKYIKSHNKVKYRDILRNLRCVRNYTTQQLMQLLKEFAEPDENGYLKCLE